MPYEKIWWIPTNDIFIIFQVNLKARATYQIQVHCLLNMVTDTRQPCPASGRNCQKSKLFLLWRMYKRRFSYIIVYVMWLKTEEIIKWSKAFAIATVTKVCMWQVFHIIIKLRTHKNLEAMSNYWKNLTISIKYLLYPGVIRLHLVGSCCLCKMKLYKLL